MTNNNLAVVEKKISAQEQKAVALVIATQEDMPKAVALLSEVNTVADGVKAEKEKITKPLNEALKAERARWKPLEDACETAIGMIRAKMMSFQKEQTRLNAEKEAKILARAEKGSLKISTAVAKLAALPDTKASIMTEKGAVTWRTVKKLVIIDAALIPYEYYDLNEARVRAALLAGNIVPGALLETEQIPTNTR